MGLRLTVVRRHRLLVIFVLAHALSWYLIPFGTSSRRSGRHTRSSSPQRPGATLPPAVPRWPETTSGVDGASLAALPCRALSRRRMPPQPRRRSPSYAGDDAEDPPWSSSGRHRAVQRHKADVWAQLQNAVLARANYHDAK